MKLYDGLITAVFKRVGKDKVTYSHQQHTRKEARADIAWWVSESMRPFSIINDCGFQSLMKTGQPDYYIPSHRTVSHDMKKVFVKCCKRMATMLQVSKGVLPDKNPTHQHDTGDCRQTQLCYGCMDISEPQGIHQCNVHFENKGVPVSILLDLVEVAQSHSGINLAAAFAKILEDFGIENKVSYKWWKENITYSPSNRY